MFDFAPTEIPLNRRTSTENPFLAPVTECHAEGTALSFVLTGEHSSLNDKGNETNKAISSVVRMLGNAGNSLGVTVRKRVEDTPAGARITFWTVPRIVHQQHAPRGTASESVVDSASPLIKVHSS